MLDTYKNLYLQKAQLIKDWEKINKNTLCNLYIENENDPKLRDSYISAIILRYWNSIGKCYYKSSGYFTSDECYNQLITAILHALKNRPWLNPASNVFNDENGPDKVINRCIESTRITAFQQGNRFKRKANFQPISIEELQEESNCCDVYTDQITYIEDEIDNIKKIVRDLFYSGRYLQSVIIDLVSYFKVLKNQDGYMGLDIKKLSRHIHTMSSGYFTYFSRRYDIDRNDVQEKCKVYTNMKLENLILEIKKGLALLKRDGVKLL